MDVRRNIRFAGVALTLVACASPSDAPLRAGASAQEAVVPRVTGSVSYRERIALPPDVEVHVKLEDVSRMDVPATLLSETTIQPQHSVPIPFELEYDPGLVDERMSYAVRATIRRGEQPLFVTDRAYPVLTRGNPSHVDLILVRSGGGRAPVADAELTNTRWLLRTLHGEPVSVGESEREPYLQLKREEGKTVAFGNGGCNRFNGSCEFTDSSIDFGHLATTMMACPEMELERRYHEALASAERYEIHSTWLILYGPDGALATFEAWYE